MSEEKMVLAGRYVLEKVIGNGGMAEVHLARDTRLHRTVAIKILRQDLARDVNFQERFRREAQSSAALNHPGIVAVYDTGEERTTTVTGSDLTIPFIVMEYVRGRTLRAFIDPEEPMSMKRAGEVMATLLSALEYSHRAGIVHRDIKPGNVMITDDGRVKVMDFGIARAIADATSNMTATQAVMGTAQYLSPEQARGHTVDARSDIYSSACVLYEMLTGRPPFTGDSPVSIAYQHVREDPQPPSVYNPAVSPEMDAVVLTGLAKDREQRYPSAVAFARDIAAAVGGRAPVLVEGAAPLLGSADAEATQLLSTTEGATEVLPAYAGARAAGGTMHARHQATASPGEITAMQHAAVDQEDEEEKHRRPWWLIGLITLAVLAAVGAMLFVLRPWESRDPQTVAVPDVVGMTQQRAQKELSEKGFSPAFSEQPDENVAKGEVISTDPKAGTQAKPGSKVAVVLSAGPEAVSVPDLAHKSREDAQKALSDLGLEMSVADEINEPGYEAGQVVRQSPSAGSALTKGETVEVTLASGNVEVPDVKGLERKAAEDQLKELGFQVEVNEREDPQNAPGTVLEQSPDNGVQPKGTMIRLVVARAEGPSAMPNLIGRSEADARKAIAERNWGVKPEREYSPTVPEGDVIRTDPAPNAEVAPGSTVTIVVSRGPEPTPDPPQETTPPDSPAPPEDPAPPHGNGNGNGNNNGTGPGANNGRGNG